MYIKQYVTECRSWFSASAKGIIFIENETGPHIRKWDQILGFIENQT